MNKQFVPYELAIELRNLGFDDYVFAFYWTDTKRLILDTPDYLEKHNGVHLQAPLWQQVIDWFKEKHNMYIEITYEGGLQKDTSLYSFQIWSNQASNKSDKMNYFKAREQAILKAIELCQKEK